MMRYNKLRKLLNEGRPSTCTRISSTWPFYTECAGVTGNFDYIEFLAEYAPFSQSDLENLARAAELYDMSTMIKLDLQNRGSVAQRAIGAGFQAVLFTDHHSAMEVRETVRMMKPETPEDDGIFGFPNRRFIGCTPSMDQMDHASRLRDVVLAFMIEKKSSNGGYRSHLLCPWGGYGAVWAFRFCHEQWMESFPSYAGLFGCRKAYD